MTEDRELIKRTLAGERGAFDEIVARYQDGLYRHLLRLTGRAEDAEDLCQEAFIALYRSLRRFNPARPIAPFLFTIATNAWKMRRRRPDRETEMPGEAMATGDSVSEQVFSRLEHQQVLAAVARLQPEQREAVSLYYDQGLSYREISGITGAPVGTVSTRLKRALETLRQALVTGGAGLVIPGMGDLPQYLTSILQGQATAPTSIGPAVAHGIATAAPAGVGILALWKETGVMMKGIYVAVSLAIVGGAVVGVPRLMSYSDAAPPPPPPAQIQVVQEKSKGLTADGFEMVEGEKTETLKFYSKGAKVRIEPSAGYEIQILRRDKKVLWTLFPQKKVYHELILENLPEGGERGFDLDALVQMLGWSAGFSKTQLGQERLKGYLCDKYSLSPVEQSSPVSSAVVWYAEKPGLVVRLNTVQDGKHIETDFSNIQQAELSDALFELPEGYSLQPGPQVKPAQQKAAAPATPKSSAALPPIASWERIQADVAFGLACGTYQEGERIAAEGGTPPEPNTAEGAPYCYYQVVNFAASLTKRQYGMMQKDGRLPYTALTQQQKDFLARLSAMRPGSPLQTHRQESSLRISEFPESITPQRPEELMFYWKTVNDQGHGYVECMNF